MSNTHDINKARQVLEDRTQQWINRYGIMLQWILLDDTISVREKMAKLEEYNIPPVSTRNKHWSRTSIYHWMKRLPDLVK